MASIRLEQLVKQFENGHLAVNDVSLEIADGEFLVLVGPSGCGKSTTLRMIAGLEEPTSGTIHIGDRVVNQVEPGKRDLAMVFQNYALYPHMTVAQNLSFGLKMRRTDKQEIEKRVQQAAQILSIETLLNRRPKQLSGGQRQRVALGRAIVRDPAAFLLDEPLSNLDARLRIQMRKELSEIHQRLKTTTIYVTHDQVEAMTLGQRIVVMHQGVIQQVATPAELYESPSNRFVASFIGSPPMNLVSGKIQIHDGIAVFEAGSTQYQLDSAMPDALNNAPACLGFRPEHLSLSDKAPRLGTVTVELVERLGNENLVYFQLEQQECVARLPADRNIQKGETMVLHLPQGRACLFKDDAAGARIFPPLDRS